MHLGRTKCCLERKQNRFLSLRSRDGGKVFREPSTADAHMSRSWPSAGRVRTEQNDIPFIQHTHVARSCRARGAILHALHGARKCARLRVREHHILRCSRKNPLVHGFRAHTRQPECRAPHTRCSHRALLTPKQFFTGKAPSANCVFAQSAAWMGPTWLARMMKPSRIIRFARFAGGSSSSSHARFSDMAFKKTVRGRVGFRQGP